MGGSAAVAAVAAESSWWARDRGRSVPDEERSVPEMMWSWEWRQGEIERGGSGSGRGYEW